MSQSNLNQESDPPTLNQEPTAQNVNPNPTETTPFLSPSNENGSDSSSESEDDSVINWRDDTRKPLNYRRVFEFMFKYAFPDTHGLRLVTGVNILIIIAIRAINLVPPYAIKLAVDSISSDSTNTPFQALIIYLLAVILRSMFSSLNHVLQTILRKRAKTQFAVDSFHRMVHLDISFHTKQKGGSRFRIIWRGAEAVATLMQEVLFNVIPT